MNTKTKKGFTLTELIIVVVIIGILAAVLIPTLTACVKKAKISNDKQLVRNLNLALSTDSLANHDGAKHKTMQEALDAAKIAGYLVDRINATKADNEILWDSKHDVFCYLNGDVIEYIPSSVSEEDQLNAGTEKDAVKLWQIVKLTDSVDLKDDEKYPFSVYAAPGSAVTDITTNKGFDAGQIAFTSISYERPSASAGHEVIIRTNSATTTLTINAASDTVNHYGSVGRVDAQKIDMNCYNEYGKAAYIKVTEGKVVAKNGGEIKVVYAANTDSTKVEVTKESQGKIETGLTVVKPVADNNEAIDRATEKGIALAYSVDGNTATNDEINAREAAVEVIAVDVIETAVEKEAVEADESDFWIVCHADAFADGDGTEQDPYIIKTARQLSLLAYNVNTLKAGFASAWYKLGKDIDLSGKAWTPIGTTNGTDTLFFTGHFDGNGKSIIGLTNNGKSDADLGLYSDELSSVKGLAASYGLFGFTQDVEISDLTMKSAKIEGSSYFKEAGIVIGMATGSVVMTDCSIDQSSLIYGKSKIGGFIGYMNNGDSDNGKGGDVTITGCDFAGTIKVSENRAGSIIGAHSEYQSGYALGHTYTFTDCDTTGHLYANESTNGYGLGLIGYAYQGTSSIQNGTEYFAKFIFDNCTNAATMSATINESTGKYVGRAVQTGLFIVKNTAETLPQGLIGQVQAGPWIISINGNYFGTKGVDHNDNPAYISLGMIEESPIEICQVISPQGAYATQAPKGKVYRISTDSMEIDDNDCLVLKANAAINFHNEKNTIQEQLEMFQNNAKIADGYHIEVLSNWINKMSEKGHWAFSIVANSD